jgi:hypothetical protein
MILTSQKKISSPLFSLCVPQFNRTSFLLKCLGSFRMQTLQNFEVCISDGGSTDGRKQEILDFLYDSQFSFCYAEHRENLRYDANLRSSINLAQGKYCLLFGNDDMLAQATTLESIAKGLEAHDFPEVVITNYQELRTQMIFRRMSRTEVIGAGPHVAVNHFRSFSFVSGILFDRSLAQKHATSTWDGSEMYQMFVGSRIIAEGGRLMGMSDIVVLKDIQIAEETVDSYARKPVIRNCPIQERQLPLTTYGQVAFEAVEPFVSPQERGRVLRRILAQVLVFTYPPWLVEYRSVQSHKYAMGIALGMRPRNVLGSIETGFFTRLYVAGLHFAGSLAGLLIPRSLYEGVRPRLYAFAKWSRG